jgi:hypothetical protein
MIIIIIVGNTPRLRELQLLRFPNGNEVRIIERVAPEWDEVAVALGFNGAKIKTIKMGAYYQPGKACLEMFIDWLNGGHDLEPPTWDALIQSLNAANIIDLANLLSTTIDIVSNTPNNYIELMFVMHAFSLIQEVKYASALREVVVDTDTEVEISTASAEVINDNFQGKPLNSTVEELFDVLNQTMESDHCLCPRFI